MDRKKMMELVDKRIGLSKTSQPDKKDTERTGRQTLKLLLADDEPETQELKQPVQPKIILFLRDDVNPAEKNFTKNPNEMYDLTADKLTSHETVLYMWTWRISWGFGKNYCRFSRKQVLDKTSINSESSVRRAIAGLRDKQFIIQVLDEYEKPVLSKSGSLYRICTPLEIASGKVEEGILLKDISIEGVYCTQLNTNRVNKSRTTMNQVQYEPGQIEPVQYEPPDRVNMNRVNMNPHDKKPDKTTISSDSDQIEPGHIEPSLKDRHNLKDSLSQKEIISYFYECIGQKQITKAKRERAMDCLKELLSEGFSLEDISFAAKWTIENSKEQPYDFSIIKHTISQAMADKEKAEAKQARLQEQEHLVIEERAEEERQEKERAYIEAFKEKLDSKDKSELRQRALAEIEKMEGVKKEFITDVLIRAKENEILKCEIEAQKRNQ